MPFDKIILAAPDIDARVFRDLGGVYVKMAKKTTMYVSSKDRALASSGLVHGGQYTRAGFTPPVTIMPGLDTIEVSGVDLTLLGHGYSAAPRDVLHDIYDVLVNDLPPQRRMGLRCVEAGSKPYWVIEG